MNTWYKLVLLQFWFFIALPICGGVLVGVLGPAGVPIYALLFWLWCWEIIAYLNYRAARQLEFVSLLQAAGANNLPLEAFLQAYLDDRPHKDMYRFWTGVLLFFVFPGYYWIHRQRSFDKRLERLVWMLQSGIPLDLAIAAVPGIVPRETALAVAVGQFTDDLPESLRRLPDRQLTTVWVDLLVRLGYPLFIMIQLVGIVSFLSVFIMPKFEKIFMDFKLRLPFLTELFMSISRFGTRYWWLEAFAMFMVLVAFNLFLFISHVRWHFPFLGGFYRSYLRGEFLILLGQMLESRKPLPEILNRVLHSQLLPAVMQVRVRGLRNDIAQGKSLPESLYRNGLATQSMQALIVSAEKANNLTWALREIGDSQSRHAARTLHRLALIALPIAILLCAVVVGFVAVSMFTPLLSIIESFSAMK
ncbi:MAG: hypothetical protein EXS16_02990 [Gemmataceae bacterium]|nr:hypothetical protein [Gemmataceae bacterium]